jgi:hypothetical protein
MSTQDLGSNYPEGYDTCLHEMPYSGLDCLECSTLRAEDIIDEIYSVLDDWDDDPEEADYTDQIRMLAKGVRKVLENVRAELHMTRRMGSKVKKLTEFARLVKECPSNSTHLMPFAADALLRQLHTDSVVSEEENNEVKPSTEPF